MKSRTQRHNQNDNISPAKHDIIMDPRQIVEKGMDSAGNIDHLNASTPTKKRRSVSVNIGESPLSWLYTHGHLDERQYLAGEKLRSDYECASLGPNVTMSWDPMPPSKGRRGALGYMESSETMVNAKERFDAALAVLGQGLEDVAWRVICNCESVSSAEKALGWPTRSGKLVLKLALDRLAVYYHIK